MKIIVDKIPVHPRECLFGKNLGPYFNCGISNGECELHEDTTCSKLEEIEIHVCDCKREN